MVAAQTSGAYPTPVRYLLSTAFVLLCLGLRLALDRDPGGHLFIFFVPAVLAAALLFGRPQGIYTMILSTLLIDFFLTDPPYRLGPESLVDVVATLLFFATGIFAATLIEAVREATLKLQIGNAELQTANARRETASRETSLLLREMNHRIRNDLQSIAAMLKLQARVPDSDASATLEATLGRLAVLGRVYDRLQLSEESAEVWIDTREFVIGLSRELQATVGSLRPITLAAEAESHRIALNRAVPIGLVINEIVTNALKHAFPDGRSGTVSISFAAVGDTFRLEIADDGVGPGPAREGGLGQTLIVALTNQLEGTLEFTGPPGFGCLIVFPREARAVHGL